MHSTIAILSILSAAYALPQNIPIPCGTHLGQIPCTDDSGSSTTVEVQTMTVVPVAVQTTSAASHGVLSGDNSGEAGIRTSNHNNPIPTCKHDTYMADCENFCHSYGYTQTSCNIFSPAGQNLDVGRCLCEMAPDWINDMLKGLGDAICIAVSDGLNDALQLSANMIPNVGEASDAAKLFKLGGNIMKKGSKDYGVNVCPDHVYTVVDPDDMNSQLGVLACQAWSFGLTRDGIHWSTLMTREG